jgi:hypothetical protein
MPLTRMKKIKALVAWSIFKDGQAQKALNLLFT